MLRTAAFRQASLGRVRVEGLAGQTLDASMPAGRVGSPPSAEAINGTAQQRIRALDPLRIPGWDALVATHREGTFFHGRGWASVLHDTYGHRPIYFCRVRGARLEGLLPVMEVSSPWTGRRGVSLPFTDLCGLLPGEDGLARSLYEAAVRHGRERGWAYLECRNNDHAWPGAEASLAFRGHVIDLQRPEGDLFGSFAPSVRRSIRKAQDAGLGIQFAASPEAAREFYALHCLSRKRHGVPPQPFRYFENIARRVLAEGSGFIVSARMGERTVAAAVFFHAGRRAFYKFGASDYAYQHLRANNLVMWEAIRRCAKLGCASLHLGRTSMSNEGLNQFKLRFGAQEESIEYCRYDFKRQAFAKSVDRADGWVNRVFRLLPSPLFRLAGQVLYPHLS